MLKRFRSRLLARFTLLFFACQMLPVGAWVHPSSPAVKAPTAPFRVVLQRIVSPVQAGPEIGLSIAVPDLNPARLYSFTVAADPALFHAPNTERQWEVTVADAKGTVSSKMLHLGDPDLYLLARPRQAGGGRVEIRRGLNVAESKTPITVKVVEWNVEADKVRNVAYKPDGDWRQAVPMTLGKTVFGTGDVTPYIPPQVDEATRYYDATQKSDALTAAARNDGSEDWLTFRYEGDAPKLVYFQLDLPERDNIPPDVSIYTEKDGRLEPYEIGMDPVTPPHEVQALPGNKFTTRTISKGLYYVRVIANHPEWQLRTQLFDPPPYADPRKAVSTAADYLLGAGDSWHANIPRTGGRLNRVGNVHAETAQCIGCHPTQFTTRGALTAMANGYSVQRKESLKFLTERIVNNPRPFYGHKEANWVRMISAPGNVTSRMADLSATCEELTGDPPSDIHTGAYNYLKLYYKGRTELPEDESNGNQPLISQYEVVYYAWKIFDRQHRRTGDAEARKYADLMFTLVAENRHRNLIDLCWQTVALVKMNRQRFAGQIKANCERILKEQRPDGQWSMQLDPKSASVEFQTGHALYALAVAGYKPDHPQVKLAIDYMMKRQQPFGGWFDPLQSYENFRTPFRETQFAVMALSEFYPEPGARKQGWTPTAPPDRLETADPARLLQQLDDLWAKPNDAVMAQTIAALKSEEPLVRHTAALALGRVGNAKAVPPLAAALGDSTKLVQRSAAVALRALGNRGIGVGEIANALASRSDRTRWGATRVFAYHSRALSGRAELWPVLLKMGLEDPSTPARMGALQALWQWYWWSPNDSRRLAVLDTALNSLRKPEHPWIARNAREVLYNVADENVRYLYNNWIPALGDAADRETAIRGQHAADELVAGRLAQALDRGSAYQRKQVLRAVTEFHLRNVRVQNTRYPRIGNDVEQTRFSVEAARLLEPAVSRALKDSDPDIRRYAAVAAFTLRENGPLPVSLALLGALADPDPGVRAAAGEFRTAVPLDLSGPNTDRAAGVLVSLLSSPYSDARQAALETALQNPALDAHSRVDAAIDELLSSGGGRGRSELMEVARRNAAVRRHVRVLSAITDAMLGTDGDSRSAAIEIVRKDRSLQKLPAVRNALEEVSQGADERSKQAAQTILAEAAVDSKGRPRALDYVYFAQKVMPVFARKSGADGAACVSCHFNHNIFKVTPPDATGNYTQDQIRETYRAALKVVNLEQPEKSLLLAKPSSSSATEGLVNAHAVAHGGGMRWNGPEDPSYLAVLAWIQGAKLERSAEEAPGSGTAPSKPRPK